MVELDSWMWQNTDRHSNHLGQVGILGGVNTWAMRCTKECGKWNKQPSLHHRVPTDGLVEGWVVIQKPGGVDSMLSPSV